jgi:hypothetical protein
MIELSRTRFLSLSRGERVASQRVRAKRGPMTGSASRVRAYGLSSGGNPLTPTLSPMGRGSRKRNAASHPGHENEARAC